MGLCASKGAVGHSYVTDISTLFEMGKFLGAGMSGSVHVVTDKRTGAQYAMKTVQLNRVRLGLLEDLKNEIQLLKQLDHPNIIKLQHTYEDKHRLYLIMELCTGGELFDHLASQKHKRYSERRAAQLMRQMMAAVAYCHAQGIAHRDLKLENFVFDGPGDDAVLKLIDFGLSKKYMEGQRMRSLVGTPYYIAPEVLRGQGYGLPCDVWGLGVIAFMLLSGKPPFNGHNDSAIMASAARGRVDFSHAVWTRVSDLAKDFVRSLLVASPRKRPDIQRALQHPWLAKWTTLPDQPIADEILDSLQHFARQTRLKKTALEVIAFSLNQAQLAEMRDTFLSLDKDHSGTITLTELRATLIARGMEESRLEEIFSAIDQDNSGEISYNEFLAATMRRRMQLTKDQVVMAFERLDVDGTGDITSENLRAVLGNDFSQDRIDEMIREADIGGDGKVNLAEFMRLMQDEGDGIEKSHFAAAHDAGLPAIPEMEGGSTLWSDDGTGAAGAMTAPGRRGSAGDASVSLDDERGSVGHMRSAP